MERLSETVLRHAQGQPEGAPVLAKGLLHLGSRAAVDQALSRLGLAARCCGAGRGCLFLPVESRFGRRAPSADRTVEGLAAARGERVANSGAMAASVLGLTTQMPVERVFLTSGPSRTLMLGRERIELRHAPEWQLVLPDRRAGEGSALLLGETGPALRGAGGTIEERERRELAKGGAQMPGWLPTWERVAQG